MKLNSFVLKGGTHMKFLSQELSSHKPTVPLHGRVLHLLRSHAFTPLPPTLFSPSLAY